MKKKIIYLLSLGALTLGVFGTIPAANAYQTNDVPYSFSIQPNQGNSDTEPRYRGTTNKYRTWAVHMYRSTEGVGTYTTYWIEKTDNSNVSQAVDVKAGNGDDTDSGMKYFVNAYNSANATDVKLTAENNNYSSNRYSVKGFWDEETNYVISADDFTGWDTQGY